MPSTWNSPLLRVETAGAAAPRLPVNVCRLPPEPVAAVAAVAAAVAVATVLGAAASPAALPDALLEPVPATTLPVSSTSGTEAKSVVIPNAALKASAYMHMP